MQLRFATANLFNYLAPPNAFYDFNNIYEADQWEKKQQWLARKLLKLDADVIGFQEIFSSEHLLSQLSELGYDHCAVVDQPKVSQDYIYSHPVVGIASRYPIIDVEAVSAHVPGTNAPFSFNRKPLRATIKHPSLGNIDVYVVHFKSQRPTLDSELNDAEPFTAWQQENFGRWLSTVQRGYEAHLLHNVIMERKKATANPVILMGDFNQLLTSQEFSSLRSTHRFRQPDTYMPLLPYHLIDSWELFCHNNTIARTPTHYTGASGQVLDYILLSSDFSDEADHPIAKVIDYHVEDQHLVNPSFELDSVASDHAFVSVTVQCAKSHR